MREIRLSGSMSGDVETEHGESIEALSNERDSPSYGPPKPPRHSSTLLVLDQFVVGSRTPQKASPAIRSAEPPSPRLTPSPRPTPPKTRSRQILLPQAGNL